MTWRYNTKHGIIREDIILICLVLHLHGFNKINCFIVSGNFSSGQNSKGKSVTELEQEFQNWKETTRFNER